MAYAPPMEIKVDISQFELSAFHGEISSFVWKEITHAVSKLFRLHCPYC